MFKFGCNVPGDYYEFAQWPDLTIEMALDVLEDNDVAFDRTVRKPDNNLKHHLLPQTHAFNCLAKAQHVLRHETLQQDFIPIAKELGISPELARVRGSKAPLDESIALSEAQHTRLRLLFRDDFDALGYDAPKLVPVTNLSAPQGQGGLWESWPAYFSDADIRRDEAERALPPADIDFLPFMSFRIVGPAGPTWAKRKPNLVEHFRELQVEFGGKLYITFLLACTIVAIRRTAGRGPGLTLFWRIMDERIDDVLPEMNSRWLTSICDTLADHGRTSTQRTLAVLGSGLMNTVKIYESELKLFHLRRRKVPSVVLSRGGPLFDGTITFWSEKGDLIANLLKRIKACAKEDELAGKVVEQVVGRLLANDTAFARFEALAGRPPLPLISDQHRRELAKAIRDLT